VAGIAEALQAQFARIDQQSDVRQHHNNARMAELTDAPDLGFRNRRFQKVPFCFKTRSIYEAKTRFFAVDKELLAHQLSRAAQKMHTI
jgi:hypothetical protein